MEQAKPADPSIVALMLEHLQDRPAPPLRLWSDYENYRPPVKAADLPWWHVGVVRGGYGVTAGHCPCCVANDRARLPRYDPDPRVQPLPALVTLEGRRVRAGGRPDFTLYFGQCPACYAVLWAADVELTLAGFRPERNRRP